MGRRGRVDVVNSLAYTVQRGGCTNGEVSHSHIIVD